MKRKETFVANIFFLLIFCIIFVRVVIITKIFDSDAIEKKIDKKESNKSFHPNVKRIARGKLSMAAPQKRKNLKRAEIKDRNGHTLAYSLLRYNIYYDGRKDLPINETSQKRIAQILGISNEKISQAMQKKTPTLLSRYATKEVAKKIYNLRLPTLLMEKTLAREYPEEFLLAQTLGFVGHNGMGLTGIENTYQSILYIKEEEPWQSDEIKLILTIDRDLQYAVEQHLRFGLKKHEAKFVSAIVEDITNGEILAMSTLPNFDLNDFGNTDPKLFFNPIVSQLIEVGSVFKIFFLAKILQDQKEKEWQQYLSEKRYYCPGYHVLKNDEIIKCSKAHKDVSLQDVIKLSCNTGMIKSTEMYTITEMHRFLKSLMIDKRTGIDLPGESRGILPPTKEWGLRTKATVPLGQGIAMTSIQLINVFSALINGGKLMTPHLAKEILYYQTGKLAKKKKIEIQQKSQIINKKISKKLVEILTFGTAKDSTGKAARNTGLEKVFGKTGTAQQVNLRKGIYYKDRYNSVFLGGYPKEKPRYAVLVMLSNPKKKHQGGLAAAPIFAEIVDDIVRIGNLKNERVNENLNTPKNYKNTFNKSFQKILNDLKENEFKKMPNFHNLSLRKALVLIEEMKHNKRKKGKKIKINITGSGYVLKQSPIAGKTLKDDDVIFVHLAP